MSDLISRAEVCDILADMYPTDGEKVISYTEIDKAYSRIQNLPSIQPEREKGEWIPMFDRWGDIVTTVCGYECSKCGEWNADNDKFCPNCGADMRGESDEDSN